MEQISAFMDGESGEHEGAAQLARLKHDPELRRAWNTWHLIGESVRGEATAPNPEFMSRFSAALAQEPTVLAPRASIVRRSFSRVALPLAASFAGVALVGWLAVSMISTSDGPRGTGAVATVVQPDNGAATDYIKAHRGVVSYVQTVAARDTDQR